MWVYVLSILAALCFGAGSVVQQRAASEAPPEDVLAFHFVHCLSRRARRRIGRDIGVRLLGILKLSAGREHERRVG